MPKLLLLLLPGERKLDNYTLHILPNRKASLIACFFFAFLFFSKSAVCQQWQFDKKAQLAYNLLLNLQTSDALKLIPAPKSPSERYVVSLAQVTELLLTEDLALFTEYERQFQKRISRKYTLHSPEELFVRAEAYLYWSLVYLKFGHDFDAALNIRRAYAIAETCKKEFPEFIATKKTLGLLNVILGAIPQKYEWVLTVLGMEGSFESGLKQLQSSELINSPLGLEARLLAAFVHGFALQNLKTSVDEINSTLRQYTDNRLVLFASAALRIKNSQSEEALKPLHILSSSNQDLILPYVNYLQGEIYLQKGEYAKAIAFYQKFIETYTGQNYLKDANYKIGLCYLLSNNRNQAHTVFQKTKHIGAEVTEADRHAARSISKNELPNVKLTQVRYFTDGGYFEEAEKLLESITPTDIPYTGDKVEYYYRKARLAHKTKHLAAAKLFYKQTIDISAGESLYFVPNSYLQLGYIAIEDKDITTAKLNFNLARSFKDHEYKNSIDSKSKAALDRLATQ